jgi:hypothetical protein
MIISCRFADTNTFLAKKLDEKLALHAVEMRR